MASHCSQGFNLDAADVRTITFKSEVGTCIGAEERKSVGRTEAGETQEQPLRSDDKRPSAAMRVNIHNEGGKVMGDLPIDLLAKVLELPSLAAALTALEQTGQFECRHAGKRMILRDANR